MNTTLIAVFCAALIGYLLGSISFAVIVSRIYAKDDVRNYGSHNAGMTNVLRVYGIVPAAFTLLGDFSKGLLAVYLGRMIFEYFGVTALDAGYVAGLAALLGHLFPLWFGFRGGKGVLTSLGIIVAINPIVAVILLVLMLPVLFTVRIVSLVSILGAAIYPFLTYIVASFLDKPVHWDTIFAAIFAALVIFMHRSNIKRLLNGTEKRLTIPKKEKK